MYLESWAFCKCLYFLDNSIILVKLQAGKSTRDVTSELQVSQSHVGRMRRKRLSHIPTSSGGRPEALSNTQKRVCIRTITSRGFETATQATKYVREECQVIVIVDTVRRDLCTTRSWALNLKQKKPKWNERYIKDSLEFASRHEHWTVDDWKHVIFYNKKKVNRFCSDGCNWCWISVKKSRNLRLVK